MGLELNSQAFISGLKEKLPMVAAPKRGKREITGLGLRQLLKLLRQYLMLRNIYKHTDLLEGMVLIWRLI